MLKHLEANKFIHGRQYGALPVGMDLFYSPRASTLSLPSKHLWHPNHGYTVPSGKIEQAVEIVPDSF